MVRMVDKISIKSFSWFVFGDKNPKKKNQVQKQKSRFDSKVSNRIINWNLFFFLLLTWWIYLLISFFLLSWLTLAFNWDRHLCRILLSFSLLCFVVASGLPFIYPTMMMMMITLRFFVCLSVCLFSDLVG